MRLFLRTFIQKLKNVVMWFGIMFYTILSLDIIAFLNVKVNFSLSTHLFKIMHVLLQTR